MGEERIDAYMENAKEHLETAKITDIAGKFFDSVFHCIMCIESATSAIILKLGATPSKRHANHLILHRLLPKVEPSYKEDFKKVVNFTAKLLPQISRTRYPFISKDKMFTPSKFYRKNDAEDALEKAEYVYLFAEKIFAK